MQSIQIDGTFTYAENVKTLKLGDQIKLIKNPKNRINSEAIGAYTMSGLKIGYVPFKSNQIDINAKYIITKIKLSLGNPVLLISRIFDNFSVIHVEPDFVKKIKYSKKTIPINNPNLNQDLKSFGVFLKKSGIDILSLGVCYVDNDFINLNVETPEEQIMFYIVCKNFYELNVFKYDEFYKYGIIPKFIYQPFQIHRLEVYLERKYKTLDYFRKKVKFNSIIDSGLFDLNPDFLNNNYGFEIIQNNNLVFFPELKIIDPFIKINYMKLYFMKMFGNSYANPSEYLTLNQLDKNISHDNFMENESIKQSMNELLTIIPNIKSGGLAYNHELSAYCPIDLFGDIELIEISDDSTITKEKFIDLMLCLVITQKQIINIFNPISGNLMRLDISCKVSDYIYGLIHKKKKNKN
jgi:hypothetical protein